MLPHMSFGKLLGNVSTDTEDEFPLIWSFPVFSSLLFIAQSFPTLWDPMDCSTPGFPAHHNLLETGQTPVHWISDAIQSSHPLLPSSLSALHLSSIRHVSNELAILIRWPKYWRFSFSISPSNKYSGLISLKIDCFDILAVQGDIWPLIYYCSMTSATG